RPVRYRARCVAGRVVRAMEDRSALKRDRPQVVAGRSKLLEDRCVDRREQRVVQLARRRMLGGQREVNDRRGADRELLHLRLAVELNSVGTSHHQGESSGGEHGCNTLHGCLLPSCVVRTGVSLCVAVLNLLLFLLPRPADLLNYSQTTASLVPIFGSSVSALKTRSCALD